MTDLPPNPDELDEGEQANDAAAAIAGFTLAQFAFGELIKNGILPKDHAEQMLRYAIETHATAGPGNRGAAEMVTVNASISFGFEPADDLGQLRAIGLGAAGLLSKHLGAPRGPQLRVL